MHTTALRSQIYLLYLALNHSGTYLVRRIVMFVIRYVEYRRLHTLGENILQHIHLLLRCRFAVAGDKLSNIYRLTNLHTHRRTETEEAAVTQTHGHNVERHIRHQLLSLKCYAEDTF